MPLALGSKKETRRQSRRGDSLRGPRSRPCGRMRSVLDAEAAEALVEASDLAALLVQALLAAGPGRMGLRIDVETQRVAGLAIGRTGRVARPVGHDDRDLVVVGMNIGFHGIRLRKGRVS